MDLTKCFEQQREVSINSLSDKERTSPISIMRESVNYLFIFLMLQLIINIICIKLMSL